MLRTAFAGRPGSVHLSIPADLAKQKIPYEIIPPEKYRPRSAVLDFEAVKRAAKLLAAANRPCLLVGHGVRLSQADGELMQLAERLGIPVATTLKGKSAFPENHPLSLGVFGFAGHPLAEAYLLSGEVDVLVVVGSSLGEFQTHSWDKRLMPQKALIQIDIDPMEMGKNYPVDVGIVGDAKAVLRSLTDTLATQYPETRPVSDRLKTLRSQIVRYHKAELLEAESTPMKPQAVMAKMQKVLPENTLLFLDNGNCVSWGIHYYEARQPNTIFASLGMAAMGYAIAAAIGGKLAAPDRPVVALVGDGAFAMNGMEIHTAAEYNIPVIWIVLNNGGHSMVYHGEKLLFGGELNSSRFRKPIDIWGLAASLGVRSFKAETPAAFEQALQAALAASAPCVIDAVVDFEECPSSIQQRAETLNKFFAGIH
jgi:acetolactate synthase I/II/III large subunit